MVTKGSYTPHGLFYWPMRGGLSPWALKKQEAKVRKSYSPAEGNLLHRGWSLKNSKNRKIDSCQSSLTHINQALLFCWQLSIKPFCYDDASIISVSRDFDRIEIEQKFIKKWTFLWFWTWKNTTLLEKVQLLLTHWLYPFILHTKQQQCIEVQFRLENTYVQLRVWLQRKNKNDWIVLRERRKY